ncbi:MAG: DUF4013 domain-containing protein [Alphaproteobacteria bacterium]|nr:DUF4013 domain-containing protein [Alphaproteobacteria bacterium]
MSDDFTPYDPPKADLEHPPTGEVVGRDSVDIGEAIGFVFKDPDWTSKVLMVGLFSLIPIAGALAALGWQRRIFEAVRRGDPQPLPAIDFGDDLGRGVTPFVAVFTMALVFMFVIIGAQILVIIPAVMGDAIGGAARDILGVVTMLFGLFALLLQLVGSIGINVVMPEIVRRGHRGESVPLLSPGQSIRAVRADPMSLLMVVVGWFVAGMIGGLGIWLCFVGMFLTMPVAFAVQAHLAAQWDQVLVKKGAVEG